VAGDILVGTFDPNVEATPRIEGMPVPVVGLARGHGTVLPSIETGADRFGITTRGVNVIRGTDGLAVKATEAGLRPPTPISVEPIGMPILPTDGTEPIPVSNEVEAPGPAKEPVVAQVPDALPVIPPPSKTEFVVLGIAAIEPPAPSDAPDEALSPKDACGIDPPIPPHVATLLVKGLMGDVPDVVGLTPGVASSVAPIGIPVGATRDPRPMPSGDVILRGGPGEMLGPPTWA
jgi:hypothetical protein